MHPAQRVSLVLVSFKALGMETQRSRNVCSALTDYEPDVGLTV
jgi:hypothetical protein